MSEADKKTLKVALLTREYPPDVYGGAGVHVTYLARELAKLVDLSVHCQGEPRPGATAHQPWERLRDTALRVISTDLSMAEGAGGADLVHSHTWYANLAGLLAAKLYGIPHVVTMHSLEPLRPWKAEQLGGGYALSSWCEETAATSADAVVAVSDAMRADLLTVYPAISAERAVVIRNGIDVAEYVADPATDVLDRYGVDPARPYVIFVGRITRQKGLPVLLRAAVALDPSAQLVLCAGQPDTPEQLAEVTELVRGLDNAIWIPKMLEKREVIQLLTHATVFACPSLYEPLGIVNLEAMACGTAVVGSRTGGIPEVVADGETGLLVEPDDPGALAAALNSLIGDPERARAMGQAGRARAEAEFSWTAVAAQTADLYGKVMKNRLESSVTRITRVLAAAVTALLTMGTVVTLTTSAHASSPPTMIRIASCSAAPVPTNECALSGRMTNPGTLYAGATATSYTTPEAVTFELAVTCYQSGAAPVVTNVEGGRGPMPFTFSLWSVTGRTPSYCTITGSAGGTGLVPFTATLYYRPALSVSSPPAQVVQGLDRLCVRDLGNSAAPRTKVVIWACGSAVQGEGWTYRGDELRIHGSMCAAANGKGTSGSPVFLLACDGGPNQIWVHRSDGEYALKTGGYRMCLTDPGFSTRIGTQLVVRPCTDARDQRWSLP